MGNSTSTVKPGGNLVLSSAFADPTSPVTGMIYLNTSTTPPTLRFYNGSDWSIITSTVTTPIV